MFQKGETRLCNTDGPVKSSGCISCFKTKPPGLGFLKDTVFQMSTHAAASNASRQDISRILLFDGVCNLCNAAVQFVIARDAGQKFMFASLQSAAGQERLRHLGLPTRRFDSLVLIEGGRFYTESSAALRVARSLGGGWPLLYAFMVVPAPVRNAVYRFVARNRYRWFGHRESCAIPTPALKARFLD